MQVIHNEDSSTRNSRRRVTQRVLSGVTCLMLSSPAAAQFEPPTLEVPAAMPTDRYEVSTVRLANGLSPVPATRTAGDHFPLHHDSARGESQSMYLFSGELRFAEVDLRIAGRGFDFVFARTYRSRLGGPSIVGHGWDHSYNVFLEQAGGNLLLHDGNSRVDLYTTVTGGQWTADGFFREITFDPGAGAFVLTFEDTSRWEFLPFADPIAPGKLSAIVDRNGNTMQFQYDPLGRLVAVQDTLFDSSVPRQINLGYDPNGFLQSVSDWTGRSVTYEYYAIGDPLGSPGDLKSVTSPAVVNDAFYGVPAGHEFLSGKTTLYTYSKGFADDQLNHNLLTITNPRGQTWLVNEYATTSNPLDLLFDHVIGQTWGDPGDRIDFDYVPVVPDPSNEFASLRVIVNDRVGNVGEHFFDARNLRVMLHEYTGRADPDLPTTATANRPSGPLRATDPTLYETRWQYGFDPLPSLVTHPDGNQLRYVYEIDLDPFAPRRVAGNLRELQRLPGAHAVPGDQSMITELFEYDPGMGSPCGSNFVVLHTDGRGTTTTSTYDANGNRSATTHRIPSILETYQYNAFGQVTQHVQPDNGSGHQRVDVFEYYTTADGFQYGYLKERRLDDTALSLTTAYTYDSIGHLRSVTDPEGNDEQYAVNQLGQLMQSVSREVTPGTGPRYTREKFYDPNDNVIRIEVENIDDLGVLQPNDSFTTEYVYDILDRRIRKTQEVDPTTDVVTEFEYDANSNRTLVRDPQAVDGSDPDDTVTTLYDERDLVFQKTRAIGGSDESTSQLDYTGNGDVMKIHEGVGSPVPRVTCHTYDWFDRPISSLDAMGNLTSWHYDANHNCVSDRVDGELVDILGGASNVRLRESTYVYDNMDRRVLHTQEFFDSDTQAPLPGGSTLGQSTRSQTWTDTSRIATLTNDNGHVTSLQYDTAIRLSRLTDPAGNHIDLGYDSNSRILSIVSTEKSDLLLPDELFTTTYAYDGLDRLTRITDNVGNQRDFGYDARDHLLTEIDPLGNITRYQYDGLDRLTRTVDELTDDGTGAGASTGIREVLRLYDSSSRLTGVTDDSGFTTTYVYDGLDRRVVTLLPDGSLATSQYDVFDDLRVRTDANGTILDFDYDELGRLVDTTVTPAPGVSPATSFEHFEYDGLDRLVSAQDDDSLVTRSYDSLSRVLEESQNGFVTTATYDGVGNCLSTGYPGGLLITRTYDALDRLSSIVDPTSALVLATYDYVGPSRVTRREHGNNTRLDLTYDGITGIPNPPGDSGHKDIIAVLHRFDPAGSPVIIEDRAFTWDAAGNKRSRADLGPGGLSHDYVYDSLYRLTRTIVTNSSSQTVRDTDYTLDDVGNRLSVDGALYEQDGSLPSPGDAQMHQYTRTPADKRFYDLNGNVNRIRRRPGTPHGSGPARVGGGGGPGTTVGGSGGGLTGTAGGVARSPKPKPQFSPSARLTYDHADRLVQYRESNLDFTRTNAYDALGRRISRTTDDAGAVGTTLFFYQDDRLIEEWDGSAGPVSSHIHGGDVVLVVRKAGGDFYLHEDDMGNVLALSDASGAVVERYAYGDYGAREVTPTVGGSPVGNPWGFAGQYHEVSDKVHELLGFGGSGTTFADPSTGRTLSRFGGAPGGDGRTYMGHNPFSGDPDRPLVMGRVYAAITSGGSRLSGGGQISASQGMLRLLSTGASAGTGGEGEIIIVGNGPAPAQAKKTREIVVVGSKYTPRSNSAAGGEGEIIITGETSAPASKPREIVVVGSKPKPKSKPAPGGEGEIIIVGNMHGPVGGDGEDIGAPNHGNEWFVADSFSFGVEREMKESGEKGGTEDMNIGIGELQECTVSKSMDMASAKLAQFAINGNSCGVAEIDFVEVAGGGDAGGTPICYLRYKLDRCFIKSWSTSGDADDEKPVEEVSFYYNKIAFDYKPTQDGKEWSTAGDMKWDNVKHVKWEKK